MKSEGKEHSKPAGSLCKGSQIGIYFTLMYLKHLEQYMIHSRCDNSHMAVKGQNRDSSWLDSKAQAESSMLFYGGDKIDST